MKMLLVKLLPVPNGAWAGELVRIRFVSVLFLRVLFANKLFSIYPIFEINLQPSVLFSNRLEYTRPSEESA